MFYESVKRSACTGYIAFPHSFKYVSSHKFCFMNQSSTLIVFLHFFKYFSNHTFCFMNQSSTVLVPNILPLLTLLILQWSHVLCYELVKHRACVECIAFPHSFKYFSSHTFCSINQLGTFLSRGSIRRFDCGNYTVYVLSSGLIRRSDFGYYIVYGMSRGSLRCCECGYFTVLPRLASVQ